MEKPQLKIRLHRKLLISTSVSVYRKNIRLKVSQIEETMKFCKDSNNNKKKSGKWAVNRDDLIE